MFVSAKRSVCIGLIIFCMCANVACNKKATPNMTAKLSRLGLLVPTGTENVLCHEEELMVWLVFVRCDIPKDTIDTLLRANPWLPQEHSPNGAAETIEQMASAGEHLSWWMKKADVAAYTIAGRAWTKSVSGAPWKCEVFLCYGALNDDKTRVYVLYTEEPVGNASQSASRP